MVLIPCKVTITLLKRTTKCLKILFMVLINWTKLMIFMGCHIQQNTSTSLVQLVGCNLYFSFIPLQTFLIPCTFPICHIRHCMNPQSSAFIRPQKVCIGCLVRSTHPIIQFIAFDIAQICTLLYSSFHTKFACTSVRFHQPTHSYRVNVRWSISSQCLSQSGCFPLYLCINCPV